MSNDDNWNQNYEQDSFDQRDDEQQSQAPKQGMSTGVKILIVLLCIFGGMFVLCCGGVVFFFYQLVPTESNGSEDVIAVQKEIADVDLPEEIKPKQSRRIDNFLLSLKLAIFVTLQPRPIPLCEIVKGVYDGVV